MSRLQHALAWAQRGFPVFPLVSRGKLPLHDDWPSIATTDPETIRRLWTDPVLRTERDYNIGTLCTGRVVVDVDLKNGKDGHNQYVGLGGHYDTLVVRTPSGGFHCYFDGPDSANAGIAPDVDIRSHRGFVVAPGSWTEAIPGKQEEGSYEVVVDRAPAQVPASVAQRLRGAQERREGAITDARDTESAIAAGINFAQSAPIAVEHQRGDETTFTTACRLVREMALSPETAYTILAEHWNPRCQPPWSPEELRDKVENAARYGTATMGKLDPSLTYAGISIAPPPTIFAQRALDFGNALDPEAMPPRPWLVDRLLMLHETTLLLAAGSAGKSSLSLALVAHLALGRNFGPYTCHVQCKSVVYNGEDDVAEQSRRLYAVCREYGLDYSIVKQSVILLSANEIDLKLVSANGRVPAVNTAVQEQLVALASRDDVGLIVYDPLVDIHDVDEGDNPHMNFVMRTIQATARRANVASLVLHHTTKAGGTKQEDRVGNMDVARGASGIVYKSRIAVTLMNASAQDCEEYGLQDSERSSWVRMDDAKMNLALANDKATWFRKAGVRIPSGDVVGVMTMAELTRDSTHLRTRIADIIIDTLIANGQGAMPIGAAVAVVKAQEPLYAAKSDSDVRHKLEGLFAAPVQVRDKTLHAKREGEGQRAAAQMVMT